MSGMTTLMRTDASYPDMLRSIVDPPETLHVLGTSPLRGEALAIVGSRKPSPYGLRMARSLAAECAAAGIPVVSGLARGIDSAAHRAVLDAGGITWAVLGSGLDRVYPPENRDLASAITASGGAVLSEFEPGTPPAQSNFPRRNRIISGLAWGTVVVEGDLQSGSLITADAALDQGREVFAVPGPADSPLSAGPHKLIRDGARIALSLKDILQELPMLAGQTPAERAADILEQKKILELLGSHSLSLEEIVRSTGWETPRLLRTLADMEAKELVSPVPGQRYART